jgi:hypothetical protein
MLKYLEPLVPSVQGSIKAMNLKFNGLMRF